MNKPYQYDILVAGELNVDLILDQLHQPPEFNKEQKAGSMNLVLGSSTAIFASNCASLGCRVAFCGKTGRDLFGDFVVSELHKRKVNVDSVIMDQKVKTGATIIIRHKNRRMMVTHPGAMESFSIDEIPHHLIANSRHLHTSSIFFQPVIKKNLHTLFEKAKTNGLSTSFDTQWDPEESWELELNEILPLTDFFMPNETELLHLTSSADLNEAFDKLSKYKTTIVVKRGELGAVMLSEGRVDSAPAQNVSNIVDTVGAGDSFNAGFLHAFLNGEKSKECLTAGNKFAAISTTAAGGTEAIVKWKKTMNS